jgi:hypothetical protein
MSRILLVVTGWLTSYTLFEGYMLYAYLAPLTQHIVDYARVENLFIYLYPKKVPHVRT